MAILHSVITVIRINEKKMVSPLSIFEGKCFNLKHLLVAKKLMQQN